MPQQKGGGPEGGPPSPWYFLAYAILLPLPYLATAIAGDYHNALTRFLFLIIVPFGFILGTCAVIYDYYILLAQPTNLFTRGTKRFFPFPTLGWDSDGHSPYITNKTPPKPCPPDNTIIGTFKGIILLFSSIISVISPATAKSLREGVEAASVAASTAKTVVVDGAQAAIKTGTTVAKLTVQVPMAAQGALAKAEQATPAIPVGRLASDQPQKGGSVQEKTLLDYAAFSTIAALIGGGLVYTIRRTSNDDSPPIPGRI